MTRYFEFAEGVNLTEHIFDQLPKGELTAKPAGHIMRGEHLWLIGEGKSGITRQHVADPDERPYGYYMSFGSREFETPKFDVSDAEWSADGYPYDYWRSGYGGVEIGALRVEIGSGKCKVLVRVARPASYRWEPVERRFLWWRWMGSQMVPIPDAKGVKFTSIVQAKIDAALAALEADAKKEADRKKALRDAYEAALATPLLILDENRTSTVDVQQTNTNVEISRAYSRYGWY